MSHELSITVEVDGKWYNIPSVFKGKQLPQEEAVERAFREKRILGGPFKSLKEAEDAARYRSKKFDLDDRVFIGRGQ